MKKFTSRMLILILIAASVYLYLFSFQKIESGRTGMVEDLRTGRIVRILTGEYNFVWQGALPWVYSVYRIPARMGAEYTVIVPLPELKELAGNAYSVMIPLDIEYSIDYSILGKISEINSKEKPVEKLIYGQVNAYISERLRAYIFPVYRYGLLAANIPNIVKDASIELKKSMKDDGIDLNRMEISGSFQVPAMNTYYDGLRHRNELRMIEKKNEKELKIIRTKIERDKLLNEEFYRKLREISGIIKENPDLLKYIYIEKLAGNAAVRITPGPGGYPGFLEDAERKEPADDEIDNLR